MMEGSIAFDVVTLEPHSTQSVAGCIKDGNRYDNHAVIMMATLSGVDPMKTRVDDVLINGYSVDVSDEMLAACTSFLEDSIQLHVCVEIVSGHVFSLSVSNLSDEPQRVRLMLTYAPEEVSKVFRDLRKNLELAEEDCTRALETLSRKSEEARLAKLQIRQIFQFLPERDQDKFLANAIKRLAEEASCDPLDLLEAPSEAPPPFRSWDSRPRNFSSPRHDELRVRAFKMRMARHSHRDLARPREMSRAPRPAPGVSAEEVIEESDAEEAPAGDPIS